MSRRVIGVFTGNRAEYGLQLPILQAIDVHPDLDYRLIVSGAHLDDDFGRTLSEIEADGFSVHAEVKIEMHEDSLRATARRRIRQPPMSKGAISRRVVRLTTPCATP